MQAAIRQNNLVILRLQQVFSDHLRGLVQGCERHWGEDGQGGKQAVEFGHLELRFLTSDRHRSDEVKLGEH